MRERRREFRYRIPEKFQVKARIKRQSEQEVSYFVVSDLSMGGICFTSENEDPIKFAQGDVLEILIFRKNLSVRVTAEILTDKEDEKRLRAKIIGITDFGREVLAGFLKEMAIQKA